MPGVYDGDRARLVWTLLGLVLALTLLYVFVSFVGTFVFGVFIYYSTRPVYRRVLARIGSRSLAAGLSLALFVLPFLLLLWYTLAIGLAEAREFAEAVDLEAVDGALPSIDAGDLLQQPEQIVTEGLSSLDAGAVLDAAVQYAGVAFGALLRLFIMFTLAYYLLKDGHRLTAWARDVVNDDRGVFETYVDHVDTDFRNVFFGNILNALLTGVIGALTFSLLNLVAPPDLAVPYAAFVGLLTGAASLVPVVGMKLVWVPLAVYLGARAAVTGGAAALWFPGLFAAVSFVVVDTIPDLVLRPYVSGRNLHLGAVMLAYVVGPILFGWYGIFLGPIVLVLSVHFARDVLPELLSDDRLFPYAVDPAHMAASEGETGDDAGGRVAAADDGGVHTADATDSRADESGEDAAVSGRRRTGESPGEE